MLTSENESIAKPMPRMKHCELIRILSRRSALGCSRISSPPFRSSGFTFFLLLLLTVGFPLRAHAQDTVTGAFERMTAMIGIATPNGLWTWTTSKRRLAKARPIAEGSKGPTASRASEALM